MPVKTTVLRLERAVREEHQRALVVARLEWERLAQAVVAAARRRGYAGDDPYLALQSLALVDLQLRRLASAVGDLWLTLAAARPLSQLDPEQGALVDVVHRCLTAAHAEQPVDPEALREAIAAIAAVCAAQQRAPAAVSEAPEAVAARAAIAAAERERDGTVRAFAEVLGALQAALSGQPSALSGRGAELVAAVRGLREQREELVRQLRDLQQRVARLIGERRQLADELELCQHELGRLRAARNLRLELAPRTAQALAHSGRRRLARVRRALAELHACLPLTAEPARAPQEPAEDPEAADLAGLLQAWREAAAAVLLYADRWRWALGVQQLAEAAPRWRALLDELVRLLAAWRARLGLPAGWLAQPERGAVALCALPPLIAEDLRALAAHPEADAALPELVRVLAPSVAWMGRVVAHARGRAWQGPDQPAEAAPRAALAQLADALWDIAGTLEACFAEALASELRLPPPEQRLLGASAALSGAVRELCACCEELAPHAPLPLPLPAALADHPEPDAVLESARRAASWLDALAAVPLSVGDGEDRERR